MNKKFSTLMALALVTGSASAQFTETNWKYTTPSDPQAAYRTFETKSANWNNALTSVVDGETLYNNATFTKDVKVVEDGLWYQLEVENKETAGIADVLIQERDYLTGKIYLRTVAKADAPLNASLWKLTYGKKDEATGGHWTLVNKETGLELTFDHSVINNAAVSEMRDGTKVWAWYDFNRNEKKDYTKLYASLHNQKYEEVMYLAYEKTTDNGDALRTKLSSDGFKFLANQANSKLVKAQVVKMSSNDISSVTEALAIKPVVAYPFHMTAQQFNTRMDADDKGNNKSFFFKLLKNMEGADNFLGYLGNEKAEDELEFTAVEDAAELAEVDLKKVKNAAVNGLSFNDGTDLDFNAVKDSSFNLNFKVLDCKDKEHKGTYLLADTAIYYKSNQSLSSPAVKFALKNWKAEDNAFMKARYYFRATYFPTNDSIVLEPLNAAVQAPFEDGKDWKDSECTKSFATMQYSKANTLVNDFVNPKTGSRTVSLAIDDVSGKDVLTVIYDNTNTQFVKLTINRPFANLTRTTVPDGLYYINLANKDADERNRNVGMSIVHNMESKLMYDTKAKNQDYSLMPATMWVVKQLGCPEEGLANYVQIQNREYPSVVFEGQLYKVEGLDAEGNEIDAYRFIDRSGDYSAGYESNIGWLKENSLRVVDIMDIQEVEEEIAYTSTHGYKWFDKDVLNDGVENNFQINWNNGYVDAVLKHVKDNNIAVEEGDATIFEIAEATLATDQGVIENEFGAILKEIVDCKEGNAVDEDLVLDQLKRKAYLIKVKDDNLIDNDELFLASVRDNDGRYYYKAMKLSEMDNYYKKLGVFYLKADQIHMDGANPVDTCYVLVDINKPAKFADKADKTKWASYTALEKTNGWMKAAVEAGSEMRMLRDNNLEDQPNDVSDAFYFSGNPVNQYINIAGDYNIDLNSNIKFFQQLAEKNYLFEDGNDANKVQLIQDINPDFHYLGLESKGLTTKPTLYVDEVVKDNPNMQRYLFGVRVDSISDGYICDHSSRLHGYWELENEAEDDGEVHFEKYNGYTAGWFLVNLEDSISSANNNMMHDADLYKYNSYTRLGFVEGIHQVDGDNEYFYVVNNGYTLKDLMTVKDNGVESQATYVAKGFVLDPKFLANLDVDGKNEYVTRHSIAGDVNTNHTFSLRKTRSDNEGTVELSEPFLLESYMKGVSQIGSFYGAWIKSENGIPVLAKYSTSTGDHEGAASDISERIGQSGIFYFETTDEEATANEGIANSSIQVVATNGAVIVKGAAGKNVVITNVLGQTIANTVVASNEAQITTPTGVVVVAIEGEPAVKAIVK